MAKCGANEQRNPATNLCEKPPLCGDLTSKNTKSLAKPIPIPLPFPIKVIVEGYGVCQAINCGQLMANTVQIVTDAVSNVIEQCKTQTPCNPPAGSICYELHSEGTPHKVTDINGNKLPAQIPHIHTWQMNQTPSGSCFWNERRAQKFTFNYIPVNVKPCYSYPSWISQQP